MKVLIVCSGNNGSISPFVKEQAEALQKLNVAVDFYLIKGKGVWGYLKNRGKLVDKIKKGNYQLINAHYGLSGLLSCLQRKLPVVTTLHGSDVHSPLIRPFSQLARKLSGKSIFVSQNMATRVGVSKPIVIPCGVDFDTFYPMDQQKARKAMNLVPDKKYILFSSSFDKKVKNYALAKEALDLLNDADIELIELKNYTRKEVALLLNSANLALLTSHSEGSPQFIKEAMACNCPIVSTDVGDVKDILGGTKGCYLSTFEAEDVASKIKKALQFENRTKGRKQINRFRSDLIAQKVLDVYHQVIS